LLEAGCPGAFPFSARQKGTVVNQEQVREQAPPSGKSIPARAGAAGKALIVWLASGSLGLAIVAFLLFKMMGC
jgi:hypothetical protein